ncbi:MAG: cobalt ECF transporter T component CbiQ [Desulfobacteraceae bacterium]|nr:cobalt ECF transporter T component CbiQ [Desulfobacteraceae bacterium]
MSQSRFLDKTLLSVARVAEYSFFSEVYARRGGVLQALDIRVKLLSFLAIIVLLSLLHSPEALWLAYGATILLALLSRVPLGFFQKRVWLFVPLFSAAVVLPALLNVITPGEPLLVLARFSHPHAWGPYTIPAEVAITRQGLWGAIVFVSRVAASVSFAVLLTVTTRWSDIFSGLRALMVPRIFVVTLSMTERYIFVFLRLIQEMYRARKSRTIRPLSSAAGRSWVASRVGVTFTRSMEMSEDIYRAMLSRGFRGDFPTVNRYRCKWADYLWLALALAGGIGLIVLERRVMP